MQKKHKRERKNKKKHTKNKTKTKKHRTSFSPYSCRSHTVKLRRSGASRRAVTHARLSTASYQSLKVWIQQTKLHCSFAF